MSTTTLSAYDDLNRLMSLMTGAEKHSAAATSTLDVVWVLYDRVLNIDPANPEAPERDRFVLSKGHGPMAYYAVLAATGFFPESWLETWASFDSPLGMHPDRLLIPGVEVGSGSLGHGLPIAIGIAVGLKAKRSGAHVYALIGDGELDEGSNWEAIEAAPSLSIDNLTLIVVDNESSSLGRPGGIAARFTTHGWAVAKADGRDHDELAATLKWRVQGRPSVVVAHVERRGS